MLKIDLLKGQGIPMKSHPGGAALLAISIAVPLIITMSLLGNYVRGTIILSTHKRTLQKIDTKLTELLIDVRYDESDEDEIKNIKECFNELHDSLVHNIQWSPILETITKNLPETLVLSDMKVEVETLRKIVQRRDDPSKRISILVPKKTLKISLIGTVESKSRDAVLKFKQKLESSQTFKHKIENIRIVSHSTSEKFEDLMFYEIACVFKSH